MTAAVEPQPFGRYQLLRKLATGGMAQIWLARQTGIQGFEKLVVVKKILPHLGENDEFVQMFLDEARIAARLSHPNIVAIHDLGKVGDDFFIAMEYIHGEDARRVWKQSEAKGRQLPIALACRIVSGAAEGLYYAHTKLDDHGRPLGIVHRDVSPQNILVSFDGAVKVVDFGIAKAADQATHTKSGVLKGKYSYMSPEQAQGLRVDQRSDVFALGVVLWELLTGTRLFKRANEILTLNAVIECRVDPPSRLRPEIPPELDAVCLKALGRELGDRYQDARALQTAIDDVLVARQLPSSSTQLAQYLREIYADRLAEESKQGALVLPDEASRASRSSRIGGAEPVAEREDRSVKLQSPIVRSTDGDPGGTVALADAALADAALADAALADAANAAPVELPAALPPREPTRAARPPLDNPTERLRPLRAPGQPLDPARTAPAPGPDSTEPDLRGPGSPEPSRVRTSSRVRVVPPPVAAPAEEPDEHTPVEAKRRRSTLPLVALVLFVVAAGVAFLFRDHLLAGPPPPSRPATLAVDTDPPGATVLVNGLRWGAVTPATVEVTAGVPVRIRLELEGYETLELPVGPLGAAQIETLGRIRLPRSREEAPAQPAAPDAGAALPPEPIEPPPTEPVVDPKPAAPGSLVVTSDVPGVVFVDGRKAGRTGEDIALRAGRHSIKVSAAFHGASVSRATSAEIKPGERLDRSITFGVGTVQFIVTPRGSGADVFYEGVKVASLPGESIRFPAGDHTFTVKNEELKFTDHRSVKVVAGETIKVQIAVQ